MLSFCDHVEDQIKESLISNLTIRTLPTAFQIFPIKLLGRMWDSIKTCSKLSNSIMVKLTAVEIRIDFHTVFWMACCSYEQRAAGRIILRDVPKQRENRNQYLNKLITNILMKTTFYRERSKIDKSNLVMGARL